ncbi:hypothetical protein J4219_01995 [Candidatus Woesearchaeota archaeon]|nr:hypothetical protein [Candidatus Woesearchaeota archaeon]
MVVSMRAREDFLLHIKEVIETLKSIIKQKEAGNINAALLTKAAILMKKTESACVDNGRPLLDAGLVRAYQTQLGELIAEHKLSAILPYEFLRAFSNINNAYNINLV